MPSSLRIALLLDPLTASGGAATHASALARELLGRGHAVRGFGAPAGSIPRSSGEAPGEAGGGLEEGSGLMGFAPDAIVAYEVFSPATWLAARRARKLGIPLVLVEEGLPERGRAFQRFLRRIGAFLWGGYIRSTADRVVVLDAAAREEALAKGFDQRRLLSLSGGVALEEFRPGLTSRLPAHHGITGRILLYVGRFNDQGGLATLVRAFAATVGQRADWSLVLAGEGPARVPLRTLADQLGVGSRVHWIPTPRQEELPGLFGSSTLFAAPALSNEIGNLKVRRAMACGLPVVASDVPRFRDLVEQDGSGLLAQPGEFKAWVDMLSEACGAPEKRRRWSRRARDIAEKRFSWPHIAVSLEGLLHELVQQRMSATVERGSGALEHGSPIE